MSRKFSGEELIMTNRHLSRFSAPLFLKEKNRKITVSQSHRYYNGYNENQSKVACGPGGGGT